MIWLNFLTQSTLGITTRFGSMVTLYSEVSIEHN